MSYARFGPASDVYVFERVDSLPYECCFCSLAGPDAESVCVATIPEMIDHLEAHLRAGHKVPADALQRLREESGGS